MKKQWIGFMIAGMLVAAVPTNVNAEDCYHNWSYSADYTKLDDTYHQAEYYCYYCNAKPNIFSFDSMPVTALMSLESMAGRLLYYFQCADMHTPTLSSR